MDSDHQQYDGPEDPEDTKSKAIAYLALGLVVVVLLFFVATGRVEIFG